MLGKIWNFILGKNGCDHEKNEETIRRLKDESIESLDQVRSNFEETRYAFEKLELPDVPECSDDPRDM